MPQRLTTVRNIETLRRRVADWRSAGDRIGLVPTMGALHAGHLSLVEIIARHCDRVVVSIFVNPTQFAAHEDLDQYPRGEAEDFLLLEATPAALLYAPAASEIYPDGFSTAIDMRGPAQGLEAEARPHFFRGVALVVAKLLIQTAPDITIFGEKDWQQLQVIRQLVRDLDIPTEILAGPTMREPDGLAMSSRNRYLDPAGRAIAAHLNVILATLAASQGDIAAAEAMATQSLLDAGFTAVDYACLRDANTLAPATLKTRHRRALIAARLGDVRLIDNMDASL